ncbi:MAG: hypothetical protein MK105_15025 [Crocinitomicaceae bacterium]|nr:hypothetical protein [Crocinitomicaceae bacterium]
MKKENIGDFPSQLINAWSNLVDICTAGYSDTIYEFDAEIMVRTSIEKILNSEKLNSFTEFHEFRDQVKLIDEKFKEVFILFNKEEGFTGNWWKRGYLKYGDDEYRVGLKEHFNIDIDS